MNVDVQERSETEREDYAKERDCVGGRGGIWRPEDKSQLSLE